MANAEIGTAPIAEEEISTLGATEGETQPESQNSDGSQNSVELPTPESAITEAEERAEGAQGAIKQEAEKADDYLAKYSDGEIKNLEELKQKVNQDIRDEIEEQIRAEMEAARQETRNFKREAIDRVKALAKGVKERFEKFEFTDETKDEIFEAWKEQLTERGDIIEHGDINKSFEVGGNEDFRYKGRTVKASKNPVMSKYLKSRLESEQYEHTENPEFNSVEIERKSRARLLEKKQEELMAEQYLEKIDKLEKENKRLRKQLQQAQAGTSSNLVQTPIDVPTPSENGSPKIETDTITQIAEEKVDEKEISAADETKEPEKAKEFQEMHEESLQNPIRQEEIAGWRTYISELETKLNSSESSPQNDILKEKMSVAKSLLDEFEANPDSKGNIRALNTFIKQLSAIQ